MPSGPMLGARKPGRSCGNETLLAHALRDIPTLPRSWRKIGASERKKFLRRSAVAAATNCT